MIKPNLKRLLTGQPESTCSSISRAFKHQRLLQQRYFHLCCNLIFIFDALLKFFVSAGSFPSFEFLSSRPCRIIVDDAVGLVTDGASNAKGFRGVSDGCSFCRTEGPSGVCLGSASIVSVSVRFRFCSDVTVSAGCRTWGCGAVGGARDRNRRACRHAGTLPRGPKFKSSELVKLGYLTCRQATSGLTSE